MGTRNVQPANRANERETLENKQTQLLERAAARQRVMLGAWVCATVIALLSSVTLLGGCGHERRSTKAASYSSEPASAPQQNVIASTVSLQGTSGTVPFAQPTGSSDEAGSVPPDVVVAVSDTFVTAGQALEVMVEGTPDVTEMALSDGRGDALPMVKDAASNLWRVNYRVPLRPRSNRVGLSVTAKNESHRWRRVWLFLQVNDGKQQVETETPDESDPEQK